MAFNNWDKLAKAQRDYPKPKFALAFVDKQLKKNANNPYLLTWKADIGLQQKSDLEDINANLQKVLQLPGFTDPQLLSYWYKVFLESRRRSDPSGLAISTVGIEGLKPWQAVAKTLGRQHDRRVLWENLFTTALQEDCWDDARYAGVNYSKEGFADKKQSHYTMILATQLAAEQRTEKDGRDDRMAQVQFATALNYMKQSYNAKPDNAIAVKEIRDLRFMGEIFKRQHRCSELWDLWSKPPEHLVPLFGRHKDDLLALQVRAAREGGQWTLLESLCIRTISERVHDLTAAKEKPEDKIWELCAWNCDLWDALLDALKATKPGEEGISIIKGQLDLVFGDGGARLRDRPLRLTYMRLRQFAGSLTVSDCTDYFQHHGSLACCFEDLRPFVGALPSEGSLEFLRAIITYARSTKMPSDKEQKNFESWCQTELNVLKFEYMYRISRSPNPQASAVEQMFERTVVLSQLWPVNPNVSYLAVYLLLTLHYHFVCRDDSHKHPLETSVNSRLLLQATMFTRILLEKDKEKQNRSMALFAARQHLNLGLGTVAFKIYKHVKCKEMLHDTLSPYVLSRISQTHPFEAPGYQGFDAEVELSAVFGAIERMEKRVDSFIYTNLPSFKWDQVLDCRGLKQKFRSSHTKHICAAERQRLARLRGENVDNLPSVDFKAFKEYSDNIDIGVFEHFDVSASSHQALHMCMPNPIPDKRMTSELNFERDLVYKMLLGEVSIVDLRILTETRYREGPHFDDCSTHIERQLREFWHQLFLASAEILFANLRTPMEPKESYWQSMLGMLCSMRKANEALRMPLETELKPQDEPTMFHENMLMTCYGQLELLRALSKLCDNIREKVMKGKEKSLLAIKARLPKNYAADLQQEVQACYNSIRDLAQSYIDLLSKRGVIAITAQVRWGPTGEILKQILSDDDVDYYAREYVESALEAWKGVLKVKVK